MSEEQREPSPGPAGPPATPPEVWSLSPRRPTSGVEASPAPELDKAPRVETMSGPSAPPSGGGLDWAKVASVARDLTERPEVLLAAAFGGGILLAIIIRRLGS